MNEGSQQRAPHRRRLTTRLGSRRRALLALVALALVLGTIAGVYVQLAHAGFACSWTGGSNNWNNAASWTSCNGTFPQAGDDVTINAPGVTVTLNVNTAVLNSLTLTAGTLSQGTGTISTGDFTLNGGTLAGGSTTITVTGNFNFSSGTFTKGTSTLVLATPSGQSKSITVPSGFDTTNGFNNLTINGAADNSIRTIADGVTIPVTGTLLLANGTLQQTTAPGSGCQCAIESTGGLTGNSTFDGGGANPATVTFDGTTSVTLTASGHSSTTGTLLPITINKSSTATVTLGGVTMRTTYNWNVQALGSGGLSVVGNALVFAAPTSGSLTVTSPSSGTAAAYNNVQLGDTTNATGNTIFSGGTTTIQKNMTLSGGTIGGTGVVNFDQSTAPAGGQGVVQQTNFTGGTNTIHITGSNANLVTVYSAASGGLPSIEINRSGTGGVTFNTTNPDRFTGDLTLTSIGSGTLTTTGATFVFAAGGSGQTVTGSMSVPNVTINAQADGNTTTIASGTTLTTTGTLTLTDGNLAGAGVLACQCTAIAQASTFDGGTGNLKVTGTTSPTFTGSATASAGSLPPFEINKTSGTLTLAGTIRTTNSWTYTGGTVAAGTSIVVFSAPGGGLSINGGPTLQNVTFNGTADGNVATIASSTTLTVNGTLTLTEGAVNAATLAAKGDITQASTFDGGTTALTINGSGTQTLTGSATTTAGDLPATTVNSTGTVNLAGTIRSTHNWTYTAGTLAPGTSTFVAAGTAFAGTQTLYNLDVRVASSITNGSGYVLSVSNTLTLTSGNFTTNDGTLWLTSDVPVAGSPGASSHVVGNFKKHIATGATSRTFQIGDAGSHYQPVTIAFASVTVAGNLTASTSPGDSADIANSGVKSTASVNRTWTVSKDGSLAFTTYSATLAYELADEDGGSTEANYIVAKDDSGTWTLPTVSPPDTVNHTITASGMTTLSTFQVGEPSAVNGAGSMAVTSIDGSGGATHVAASSSGHTIVFTYTAAATMTAGSISLTVPGTWTAPSTSSSTAGYTTSSVGTVGVVGQVITVTGLTLNASDTVVVTYGASGQTVTADSATGAVTWTTKQSVNTSSPTVSLTGGSPAITQNAPDGSGTPSVSPGSVTAGASTTLTFTYTAATGGLSGGSVQVPIPATWTAPQKTGATTAGYVTATVNGVPTSNITIAGAGPWTITVTSVTLAATQTVVITYGDTTGGGGAAAVAPTAVETSSFQFKEQSTSLGSLVNVGSAQTVSVVAGAAAKLAITSVPGSATAGSSFSVTVQSQDTNGNPANVSQDTGVSLAVASGTGGTLSGNTATITNGSNSVTLTGVQYTKATSITLTAARTSGDVLSTSAASSSITVVAGGFTKLQLLVPGETADPGSATGKTGTPSARTAGSSFSVTVNAVDQYWNPVSATDTIHITSTDGAATLPADAALSGGTQTFSVTFHTAGSQTITAADLTTPAKTANTSPSITVNAGAASQLVITSVPGSATAGSNFSVTVQSQDADGNPANVSQNTGISLALASGTGGILSGNTGTITNGTNSVTLASVQYTKATSITLTAARTSGDVLSTSAASSSITVGAGSFAKLQLLVPGETADPGSATGKTGTPSARTAGSSFSVTVNAVDQNWNPVSATDTVAITSSDTNATLPANAALSGGTQTFSFTFKTAAPATITATDVTDGAKTANISPSITVNAGPFTKLQLLVPGETADPGSTTGKTGSPSARTAGTPFSVTVNAVDANWNVVGSVTDTVAISSSDANATLPANNTLSSGTQSFNVTFKTAAPATVTATDVTDGLKTASASPSITVNAGAFAKLQLLVPGETAAPGTATGKTGSPTARTAGSSFSVTVNAVDQNWNLVSGAPADTIHVTSTDGAATLPSDAALASGTQTFSVTFHTAGTATITAHDNAGGITDDTSPSITVNAGAVSKLAITSVPGSATAGSSFSVTVQSQDADGNPANVSQNTGVSLAVASGTGGTLSGNTGTITNGTSSVTLAGVQYTKATNVTLTAARTSGDTLTTSAASSSITINPGAASKLAITATPGSATAATSFSVTVQSQDTNGNAANVSADTGVSLAVASGTGGTLSGNTGTITNGTSSVTLAGVQYTKATNVTLTAARTSGDTLTTSAASSSITINAGAFTKLQLLLPGETAAPGTATGKTGSPSGQTNGSSFSVTVNAVDANWNVVTSAPADMIHITSSDGAATLPTDAALSSGTKSFTVTLNTTGSQTITAGDATDGAKTSNTSPSVNMTPPTSPGGGGGDGGGGITPPPPTPTPSLVGAVPADGATVSSATGVSLSASASVNWTGMTLSFIPQGSTVETTSSLAPGTGPSVSYTFDASQPGLYVVTGTITNAGGSVSIRTHYTVFIPPPAGGGGAPVNPPPSAKNVSSGGGGTLVASTGLHSVTWTTGSFPTDANELRVDPQVVTTPITGGFSAGGTTLNITLLSASGSLIHALAAPIEIVFDETATGDVPVTSDDGATWRTLRELPSTHVLPDDWADGFWRETRADGTVRVHILTRHLTLFAVLKDTQAPSVPDGLTGSVDANGTLTLKWNPATDNSGQIASYTVAIDGTAVTTVPGTQTSAAIPNFSPTDTRVYQVLAKDAAGNTGPLSAGVTQVPNLVGLTLQSATAKILERGFTVGTVTQLTAAAGATATVVEQSPPPPSLLRLGSPIDLKVSGGTGRAQLKVFVYGAKQLFVGGKRVIRLRVKLTLPVRLTAYLADVRGKRYAHWTIATLPSGYRQPRFQLPEAVKLRKGYRYHLDLYLRGGGQHQVRHVRVLH